MVYKIPTEDIKSLAKSFSELEKGELNIAEPLFYRSKEVPETFSEKFHIIIYTHL